MKRSIVLFAVVLLKVGSPQNEFLKSHKSQSRKLTKFVRIADLSQMRQFASCGPNLFLLLADLKFTDPIFVGRLKASVKA